MAQKEALNTSRQRCLLMRRARPCEGRGEEVGDLLRDARSERGQARELRGDKMGKAGGQRVSGRVLPQGRPNHAGAADLNVTA